MSTKREGFAGGEEGRLRSATCFLQSRAAVDSQTRMDVIANQGAAQSPTRPRFLVPGPTITFRNKFLEAKLVCRFKILKIKSRKIEMCTKHCESYALHFPLNCFSASGNFH